MSDLIIGTDDPRSDDVQALLETHLNFARDASPPEDSHALDGIGLLAAGVSFFSARREGTLLGVGALKRLDAAHVELKSMHIAEEARGQGVGRAMLDHLIALALARGFHRVSLETGSMEAFAASRALYESAGFEYCAPFSDYVPSRHSVFMTLDLGSRVPHQD